MTKKVRVENADNSGYKIAVETWQKGADGDTLISTKELPYAAELGEFWVHSTQYLKIVEIP